MATASKTRGARHGGGADPNVIELGKLMLARAPALGKAMADLLCREIDAYRDGSVVSKDQVAESCVANVTFIFESLAGNDDADVAPAAQTGTARALAGVPLPAVMTAYRIGFRFMWENTLATAREAAIPTESILDATARVFFAQDTFTQAMSTAYRQQLTAQILEREEERSALVEALLSSRITDRHSLWEAADLLRLPTSGPYAVVAAELPAIGKLGLPTIENKLSVRDIRSAWRLLPDLHVGIAHVASEHHLERVIALLTRMATHRVGVSARFDDLRDTPLGLHFAKVSLRGQATAAAKVAVFDGSMLTTAAVSAPAVMVKSAAAALDRFNDLPDEEREILFETFRVWLDNDASVRASAEVLFVHPNTVRKRLHRIERRTGRLLSRPRDVIELTLALEVHSRLM